MSVARPGPESGIDCAGLAGGTFEEFYAAQYRAVVRLAAALVGRWDVAEELVQDAFIALYPRWGRVSRYDAPDAWLRRVVLNRSFSALRRRAAEARVTTRLAHRRPEAAGADDGPDTSRVGGADVWHAVAELPKRQAQVIALMYLEERTVAEVAVILECGENTVRTRLGRARRTLSSRLGTDGAGAEEDA